MLERTAYHRLRVDNPKKTTFRFLMINAHHESYVLGLKYNITIKWLFQASHPY